MSPRPGFRSRSRHEDKTDFEPEIFRLRDLCISAALRDLSWVALLTALGCGGSSTPTPPVQPTPPPADAREAARCLDAPALDTGKLAGFALSGHTITGAGDTIGVIADTGGAAPTTLAALGRLRAKLDKEHVSLVISLGGVGATQADIEAALGALATGASWPVVALPGDLEPDKAHAAAVEALRGKGAPVIDGRRARWIELTGATIGTLPGAGAVDRLVAGPDGCGYRQADLDTLATTLDAKPGLRVIAAWEAPRGASHGEPTGDLPNASHSVDLVLAGAGDASEAAAGGRDGNAVVLRPGPADATTRLPGPHTPTAGILAIHDGRWTWRTLADAP